MNNNPNRQKVLSSPYATSNPFPIIVNSKLPYQKTKEYNHNYKQIIKDKQKSTK